MEATLVSPEAPNPAYRLKAKVCLVGEPEVGKTSLVRRFVHNQFDGAYVSTLGVKVSTRKVAVPVASRDERFTVDMTIWDIMGVRRFRELLKDAYFYGARGILAVCDTTRNDTLNELSAWLSDVFRVTGTLPVRILANKADLEEKRAVTEEALRPLSEKYRAPFFVTSAKTGQNVEAAFESLGVAIAEEEVGRQRE